MRFVVKEILGDVKNRQVKLPYVTTDYGKCDPLNELSLNINPLSYLSALLVFTCQRNFIVLIKL